ncbi:MAG: EamA family transporter [Cyclobacteriaceae bacterium]|nr:EamA family transporter [Cyclobacteriaceae bacterium]
MIKEDNPILPYLALTVVCIAWGTTYLALRIGVLEFPPFLFSAIRQITAGILLVGGLLAFGKVKLPDKPELMIQAIGGFFMITLGNGLVGWAEVYVPSGLAAIICSIVPIWVILINLVIAKDEKPTFPIVMGLMVGLSGIILIFSDNLGGFAVPGYAWGIAFIILANLGWAAGSIWMKRKNQTTNPFLNAGLQMFFGGILLLPFSLAFDNLKTIQWSNNVIYSLVYLILVGSIAAYASYSYAIKKLPITIVTLYAYINPIVAVLLGWLVLEETLNLKVGVAIGITLIGIYMVNRGYQFRNLWKAKLSTSPD